jgi:hypothetical protein
LLEIKTNFTRDTVTCGKIPKFEQNVFLFPKFAIVRASAPSVDRKAVMGLSSLLRYLRDGKGAGLGRGGNYTLETIRIPPNAIKGNRKMEI